MWVVLGAPLDSSGTGRGEEHAPDALRAAGLPAVFGAADAGDVAPPLRDPVRDPETGVIAFADLRASSQALREAVAATLRRGERRRRPAPLECFASRSRCSRRAALGRPRHRAG